ncbi:hypothetical protein LOAG_08149 [Loa loa]|uniref:Uncharacterized protein n=1 Tax=Loa loa TaxID=7209 RepID=A0A1S0TUT0_LOALO|nr:hypothetical protein LOAG_08149 [Loa loa]EFO20341.1 hypothetical protein LOAG_08149 [Loa loa]
MEKHKQLWCYLSTAKSFYEHLCICVSVRLSVCLRVCLSAYTSSMRSIYLSIVEINILSGPYQRTNDQVTFIYNLFGPRRSLLSSLSPSSSSSSLSSSLSILHLY